MQAKKKQHPIWYALKLVRTGNLLILALAQYLVSIFIVSPNTPFSEQVRDPALALLALSTMLIAAAGYMINDYYDVKIDAINKPERVVVGRFLRRRTTLVLHLLLNLVAFGLALVLSWRVAAVHVFAAVLLWLYSNQLKRLPLIGNVAVAALSSLALVVVWVYYEGASAEGYGSQKLILAYAGFAFLISLIREIIKDMEDMKGDASFNCLTLPLWAGVRRAKWVIYVLGITLMAGSFYFFWHGQAVVSYYLLVLIEAPLLWLLVRLWQADKVAHYRALSTLSKGIMLTGLGSMVFL